MPADIGNYDYAMYTDAFGDDGLKFHNTGTSIVYATASFVTRTDKIEHNKLALLEIKKILNGKPQDEIKSRSIIKHKRFDDVCEILKSLDGFIVAYVIMKERMLSYKPNSDNGAYKLLSGNIRNFTGYCHSSILTRIPGLFPDAKFVAIIDNMKKDEMDAAARFTHLLAKDHNVDVKFADSKSADHSLLQVADLFAGMIGRMFTSYLSTKGYSITPCITCIHKKLRRSRPVCRGNPFKLAYPHFRYFHVIRNKLYPDGSDTFYDQMGLYPPCYTQFAFLDCITRQKKKP